MDRDMARLFLLVGCSAVSGLVYSVPDDSSAPTLLEEVVVEQPGVPGTELPLGTGISGEALKTAPGSSGDPLRTLQAIPGMVFVG